MKITCTWELSDICGGLTVNINGVEYIVHTVAEFDCNGNYAPSRELFVLVAVKLGHATLPMNCYELTDFFNSVIAMPV